jgi:deoxyribonuclease-4
MRKLGVHTSIAGGLHMGIIRAYELGCSTVQIFSHNPRSWKISDITDDQRMLFMKTRKKFNISPVYIHASYLINIASRSKELRNKSVKLLKEEMRRADALGADFVIFHTGSAHDGHGKERAIKSIIETLKVEHYKAGLLIENTSGKSGDIAFVMHEMAEIIKETENLLSGICIDICHAFAAGYNLLIKHERERLIEEIKNLIGIEKLKLIHLNDSKGGAGTGMDRHEHLGSGWIGMEALGKLIRNKDIREVPLILETPKKTEDDDLRNLAKARDLLS